MLRAAVRALRSAAPRPLVRPRPSSRSFLACAQPAAAAAAPRRAAARALLWTGGDLDMGYYYKYVKKTTISFNPWDPNADSTAARELWVRLTTKKLEKANKHAKVDVDIRNTSEPTAVTVEFIDGSKVEFAGEATEDLTGMGTRIQDTITEIELDYARAGKTAPDM